MNYKKCISIAFLSIFLISHIFTQENNNSPIGEWAVSSRVAVVGDYVFKSEYNLEISARKIIYIENKTQKFITFPYYVDTNSESEYPCLVFTNPEPDSSLKLEEIDKDLFFHLTQISGSIPFSRKNDSLDFFLTNSKGKEKKVSFISTAKKEEKLSTGKKAEKFVFEAAGTYLAYKAADYLSGKVSMQDIADDCLKDSKAIRQ